MPYLGKTPSQATRQRYYKTASGGETSISGTMTTGGTLTFNDGEFVDVKLNGVSLVAGTDYNTTTANTIGGLSALSANDQVEIIVYDTFSVFGGNVDGDFNLNNGTMTLTRDDNDPQLIIKSTDADASVGPEIELFRDSASPADSDAVGQIQFLGKNDAAETILYGEIDAFIRDASDGTEDGEVRINVMRGGTSREALSLGQSDVVFNEGGEDVDFRIESDDSTHCFFLQGSDGRIALGASDPQGNLQIGGSTVDADNKLVFGKSVTTSQSFFPVIQQASHDGAGSDLALGATSSSGKIRFFTGASSASATLGASSNAERMNIDSSGNVNINDGNLVISTSGHGIDFSATSNAGNSASMTAELLDDYEEGTWTPTAQTDSGNAASLGSVSGLYTKIGRMVFLRASIANIDVTGSGVTSSEPLRIGGLPFTCDGSFTLGAAVSDNITLQGSRTQLNSQANTAEYITFTQSGGSSSETTTDHGDIDATTSDIFFSISYFSNQ